MMHGGFFRSALIVGSCGAVGFGGAYLVALLALVSMHDSAMQFVRAPTGDILNEAAMAGLTAGLGVGVLLAALLPSRK